MWNELLPLAAPGGAMAVLTAAVWMIFTGRLIPGSTHERMLSKAEAEIGRLNAALDKVEKQRDDLLELATVTVGIVSAIPRAKETS